MTYNTIIRKKLNNLIIRNEYEIIKLVKYICIVKKKKAKKSQTKIMDIL